MRASGRDLVLLWLVFALAVTLGMVGYAGYRAYDDIRRCEAMGGIYVTSPPSHVGCHAGAKP